MFEIVRTIHAALHSDSTTAFVCLVSFEFGILGGLMGLIVDLSYKRQLVEKETIKAVYLECQMIPFPVPLPANSTIYYMEPAEQLRSGLSHMQLSAAEKDQLWPVPSGLTELGARCHLSNFGDDPIFSIVLSFKVEFLETKKTDVPLQGHYGWLSGAVSSSYTHTVSIRALEPKAGFTFYIRSQSPLFVRITAPIEATFEPASRKARLKLPLKTSAADGNTMMFVPNIVQEKPTKRPRR